MVFDKIKILKTNPTNPHNNQELTQLTSTHGWLKKQKVYIGKFAKQNNQYP